MTSTVRLIVAGAAAVVAFDALASAVSRATGISYTWASLGSWILYAGTGYLVARSAPVSAVRMAAIAGAVLGATDASIGWAISWMIGPGRMPEELTPARWVWTLIFMMAMAAGIAALGGRFGRPHSDTV